MSVIIEVDIPSRDFELGRILTVSSETKLVLETMVPLEERPVPFFSVYGKNRESFESSVRNHPSVESLQRVQSTDEGAMYAMDWDVSRDLVVQGLQETDAKLLSGTGGADSWRFDIQFRSHEVLSRFREWCANADISLEVRRIYNPTRPDSGPWYGLTEQQRLTLMLAVEEGYYSIPREVSTQDIADEFDISDQAVTERLRRAIVALVENTLLVETEATAEDG